MPVILFLIALAAGVANPFQSGLNSELNKQLARPVWTGIFVYASGLVAVLLLQLFVRESIPQAKFTEVPWWAWLGGVVSILSTVVAITFAQRMGSAVFTGATLTASLITSVVLDHFGLIGFRQHSASPLRMTGCALMVAGLWLIARF